MVHDLSLAYKYETVSENYRLPEDIKTSWNLAQEATSLQILELEFFFREADASQISALFSDIEAPPRESTELQT